MDSRPIGLLVIALGVVAVVVGIAVYFGAFSWFGRLPGDFRVERPSFRFYFPLTSMILISLLLTLVVNLVRRLF